MGRKKAKDRPQLEQFVMLIYNTMDTPAWRSLSTAAKALYPMLKRQAGARRNGQCFLSVRDAADYLGVNKDTASKALWELQARGFLVPTQIGSLGISGEGRATTWRLTELGTVAEPRPSKEYLQWQPGSDFLVHKGKAGGWKKQNPVPPDRTSCPASSDVVVLPCPTKSDVLSHQSRRMAQDAQVSCPTKPDTSRYLPESAVKL